MGGDAFTFSPLSVPYIVTAAALVILGLMVVLIRGNALIRVGLLTVTLPALVYAAAAAITFSCQDRALAYDLARFFVGTVLLVGPALLLLLLAVAGRFERYRWLVGVAAVLSASACVLTWSTELVLAGVWKTGWGLYYPLAGPLNDLAVSNIVVWPVVGVLITRRAGAPSARLRQHFRRVLVVLVLGVSGASDALLAHGIGVYPLSFVPGTLGALIAIIGVVRYDLLHARGVDRAAIFELGVFAATGAVLFVGVLLLPDGAGPAAVVAVVVPILAVGQIGLLAVRRWSDERRQSVTSTADRALEEFVDRCDSLDREQQVGEAIAEFLQEHARLRDVRLYVTDPSGRWQATEDEGAIAIDARVRAWLIANPEILIIEDLATRSLGGLREPVQRFMALLDAEVVVPLVDRSKLVGGVVASQPRGGRALRDEERELVRQAAQAAGRALTYMALFRDAAERMEVAREVEVASAVQHARGPGQTVQSFDGCRIISYYQPAAQFGGDWWTSHRLPDGRVLVAIGDVTGYGVPAALISATIEGACETAQRMLGASFEVLALLELLNRTVQEVGGEEYAMSCFAALIDPEAGRVSFANAGHPFPYVVRRPPEGSERAELRALVSRGTLLGTDEPYLTATSFDLEPDDLLVFYSDSLVDSSSPEGERFGDRRLQRILRHRVRGAGDEVARLIIDEANEHYRGQPIVDDITLLVVRL